MKASELKNTLSLDICSGESGLDNELKGCYIGDLLSLAMARLDKGNIWITIQTNINIIAVASLSEIGCIILAEGLKLDENTYQKAESVGIPVFSSDKSAYDLAKKLALLNI